jgi:hypothetical protein
MNRNSPSNASAFACVLDAIEPAQRQSHITNAKGLFNLVTKICELEDGYSFSFGSDARVLKMLAEFISLEKLCCPFFGFMIVVTPQAGEIVLRLTGHEGVKPFIQAEIGEIIDRPIVST